MLKDVTSGEQVKQKLRASVVQKRGIDRKYVIKVLIASFFSTVFLSLFSEYMFGVVSSIIAVIFILIFIFVGVVFDAIGIAVTSGNEKPFHAMSSRRMKGASTAVKLIRNSEKVSNICNDVISDICGIISGSAGAAFALRLIVHVEGAALKTLVPLAVLGFITCLTIGGKAIGKSIAINHSNIITYRISVILSTFKRTSKSRKS